MRKFGITAVTLVVASLILSAGLLAKSKKDDRITVGISQIVEHLSLDESRRGVIDGLKEKGYDESKVEIVYKNAQGDFPTSQLIAQEFNDTADIIVAVATPAAQAAVNVVKTKPVFFTVVAYPESAGVLQKNVTGACNRIPTAKHVALIKELLPKAKKIGIIYNNSEKNSAETMAAFSEKAKEAGYELVVRTVTTTNDIASALDSIVGEIDLLYSTNDNMIATAYPIVIDKCNAKNVPIISAVKVFVDQGALATEYIDEYDVGIETGHMIARYLEGEKIENMPYIPVEKSTRYINPDIAKKFGI